MLKATLSDGLVELVLQHKVLERGHVHAAVLLAREWTHRPPVCIHSDGKILRILELFFRQLGVLVFDLGEVFGAHFQRIIDRQVKDV